MWSELSQQPLECTVLRIPLQLRHAHAVGRLQQPDQLLGQRRQRRR